MSISVNVQLGHRNTVKLSRAILIYESKGGEYGSRQDTFASVHGVRHEGAVPVLEPGSAMTLEALRELSRSLSRTKALELLPEHVLAVGPETLVWFEPAWPRVMFYECNDPCLQSLSGRTFPQPALLFIATARQLTVLALADDTRPTPDTPLYVAPYWNTTPTAVCLGTTALPESLSVKDTWAYSSAFFASAFTHGSGVKLYTAWGGSMGELWQHVQEVGHFPKQHLVATGETLGGILGA